MEENIEDNPMRFILGMMVESSLEVAHGLHEIVNKYQAHNIDVVPISELEEILHKGIEKTMEEGSLTNHLLGGLK